jgi:plasmid stability protein
MSQITVRGLEPEIEQKIRQMAKDRHQSINYVLAEIIQQTLGKGKRKPAADTLKALAGGLGFSEFYLTTSGWQRRPWSMGPNSSRGIIILRKSAAWSTIYFLLLDILVGLGGNRFVY